jgi:hypothetical protein
MASPLFFLLASVIQDVITSKTGRGVVLKIIRRPFLKDNWRRMVTDVDVPGRFAFAVEKLSVRYAVVAPEFPGMARM